MAQVDATREAKAPRQTSRHDPQTTRRLLLCGVVAGPLYVIAGITQILMRDGYDVARHTLSLTSNGDLGWIQIANFVLSGALVVACAIGLRRVLRAGRGRKWGPRLIGTYGLGLIAAGLFVADPYDGFPPGTPAGIPESVTWHGALHLVAAQVSFLSLVAACVVFTRRYLSLGERGWAAYAAATALFFLLASAGFLSGSGQGWTVVMLHVAVAVGWAWVLATAAHLLSGPAADSVSSASTEDHSHARTS